jgi:hypothetical protein
MKYKDFLKLLEKGEVTERTDLKLHKLDTGKYYLDKNERVINFLPSSPHDSFLVFDSVQALQDVQAIAKADSNVRKHLLHDYQDKIKQLPESIEAEKDFLAKFLLMEPDILDFTFNSLKQIDRKLKKVSQTIFFDILFPSLVAYMGETIRRERNGNWVFKSNREIIEPYINLPSGKSINIFLDLYKDAYEEYKTFSLFGTAQYVVDDFSGFFPLRMP